MSFNNNSNHSKTVGEIFKVLGGGTPKTSNPDFWNGHIPWITSADLDDDFGATPRKRISKEAIQASATNLVPAGSIIVATRVGLGKLAIAPTDICFSQDCQGLIVDQKICCSKFAALQLKLRVQNFQHISRGTTISGVTKKQLLEVPFDLPPLNEQRRIVAEIEKQFTRLDAGVPTESELARAEGRDYESAKVLLQRILTERREKWNGRGKYKEPAAPDVANLPELPEGWVWANLDAIAEVKGGITKDSKRNHTPSSRLVPYLRVANVQRGYIDLSEVKEIEADEEIIKVLSLQRGDILFNEGGDRDKLGRGWVWNEEIPECIHQNHVFRARVFAQAVNPKFVSWYGNTFGQQFFFDEGKHTTNLASISMTKLKGLPIPLPSFAEQERIVAEIERRLSMVDELEATITANLQRALRLRKGILEQAFNSQ